MKTLKDKRIYSFNGNFGNKTEYCIKEEDLKQAIKELKEFIWKQKKNDREIFQEIDKIFGDFNTHTPQNIAKEETLGKSVSYADTPTTGENNIKEEKKQ